MPAQHSHRAATLERRRALLDAALEVVAERGIGATTHREIARRAGVSLSTTSYFFDSLDDLLLETLRHFSEQVRQEIEALRVAARAADLAPVAVVDALVERMSTQPELVFVAQFEAYLETSRRPELREDVKRTMRTFEALAADLLAEVGAQRPADAARVVMALLDGFALHQVAWPRRPRQRAVLREALVGLLEVYAPGSTRG